MSRALRVLATLAFGSQLWAESSGRSLAPSYSSASIVNSASYDAVALSPNSIATIFGTDLSYSTTGLSPADIGLGFLPTRLGGVRVYVAGLAAGLYYVSPTQINFLVPANLRPGEVLVYVVRESTHGPFVTVTLEDAYPGLYQPDAATVVATHADGSLVTQDAQAHGGELVVLYATGLGRTAPEVVSGEFSDQLAPIVRLAELTVLVAGAAVDPRRVQYAGVAPGAPGLYLVQVRLPDALPANPEVRLAIAGHVSPPARTLPAAASPGPMGALLPKPLHLRKGYTASAPAAMLK